MPDKETKPTEWNQDLLPNHSLAPGNQHAIANATSVRICLQSWPNIDCCVMSGAPAGQQGNCLIRNTITMDISLSSVHLMERINSPPFCNFRHFGQWGGAKIHDTALSGYLFWVYRVALHKNWWLCLALTVLRYIIGCWTEVNQFDWRCSVIFSSKFLALVSADGRNKTDSETGTAPQDKTILCVLLSFPCSTCVTMCDWFYVSCSG